MKQLIFLLTAIFLIGIASAQVSISPSEISLGNVFPNQVYHQNVIITTDITEDGYNITLTSDNSYVTIIPNEFLVNGTLSTAIDLIFSDITPVNNSEPIIIIPEVSSGGGGGHSSSSLSSKSLIINTLDICNVNTIECFGDSVYLCEGFGWKYIRTCDYGCSNGECLNKKIELTNTNAINVLNESKGNINIIYVGIALFTIVIIVIFIIIKRRNE